MTDAYGPPLPPGFKKQSSDTSDSEGTDLKLEEDKIRKSGKMNQSCVGPLLPPGFKRSHYSTHDEGNLDGHTKSNIGPTLPPGFQPPAQDSDGSDDDVVGPVLPNSGASDLKRDKAKLARLKEMMKQKTDEPKRDTWMTELPPELSKNFGLEARTFSGKTETISKKDRAGWTETPADKAKKIAEGKEDESSEDERERLQNDIRRKADMKKQKLIEKCDKRGKESLMDKHRKKLKEKKAKSNEPMERKAFDRDVDLKVNRVDAAKREAFIKQSSQLSSKFGRGSTTSSFL